MNNVVFANLAINDFLNSVLSRFAIGYVSCRPWCTISGRQIAVMTLRPSRCSKALWKSGFEKLGLGGCQDFHLCRGEAKQIEGRLLS